MRITIAAAVDGQHKDWDIDPDAMKDTGELEQCFDDLGEYLDDNDGQMDEELGYRVPVDSGGAIRKQVWYALLVVWEQSQVASEGSKRTFYKNLTLANGPDTDMDVQVKVDLDLD